MNTLNNWHLRKIGEIINIGSKTLNPWKANVTANVITETIHSIDEKGEYHEPIIYIDFKITQQSEFRHLIKMPTYPTIRISAEHFNTEFETKIYNFINAIISNAPTDRQWDEDAAIKSK